MPLHSWTLGEAASMQSCISERNLLAPGLKVRTLSWSHDIHRALFAGAEVRRTLYIYIYIFIYLFIYAFGKIIYGLRKDEKLKLVAVEVLLRDDGCVTQLHIWRFVNLG